jgi:hypothetical protein
MYRATTPTHNFCFGDVDPQNLKTILITYVQNDKIVLEKTKSDLEFETKEVDGETHYHASLKLSQEETSSFIASSSHPSPVSIQVRAADYDGNVIASNIMKVSVLDVLNDEVLE